MSTTMQLRSGRPVTRSVTRSYKALQEKKRYQREQQAIEASIYDEEENTLTQKEEVGDVLHYIDFHQLQIENKQYIAKIEERNDELISVKHSGSKTTQVLNELKRKLNVQLEDADWLVNEVKSKEQLKSKLILI